MFVPNFVKVIDALEVELKLFALSRGKTTSNIKGSVNALFALIESNLMRDDAINIRRFVVFFYRFKPMSF